MALSIGYTLSSEEFGPRDLLRQAQLAEEAGFDFLMISDHFHPWIGEQGHSPFVWSVIGGIAQVTERIPLGTGVTCPTVRIHPAIIAQAAATAADMMPGRFFLGVGSGEYLNEHILGDRWPAPRTRLDMLEDAVSVIRQLWKGGTQTIEGDYFFVDEACIYTLPQELPPIMVAAAGPMAARLAGRAGDGLICTAPNADTVRQFQEQGDPGRPRYGQLTVCWDESEAEARRIAHRVWPNAAASGPLNSDVKGPAHFEAIAELTSEDAVALSVVCGPDPARHMAAIDEFAQAGFDHVYVHQVGPRQEDFIRFFEREVLPRTRQVMPRAA